jgi:predicted lipoprotein with Yx(FWY)xxD motif
MRISFSLLSTALIGAAVLAGCSGMSHDKMAMSKDKMPMSMAAPAGVKSMGGVLVGANGMTLYTYDKDTAGSGKSTCNGPCATNWPPLMGTSASGDYSVVTRDDGAKQIAYKGKPLYFWIKDSKPGDMTGDGFNGVWRVAK